MRNKDDEFQLERQNTEIKPHKSMHGDLKTKIPKKMNPWLGRQRSCLDTGDMTLSSSH